MAQTVTLPQAVGGDPAALRQLVTDHQHAVWRICCVLLLDQQETGKLVAEVFHEALTRAAEQPERIGSDEAFGRAARSLARAKVLAILKKRAESKGNRLSLYRDYLIDQFNEDKAAMAYLTAVGQGASRCVAGLPEQPRQVLELHWVQGQTAEAIGKQLGRPASAIARLINKVRLQLNQCLMKEFDRL